ncbi:uracil-DNA glycosylase family protein [Thomasclavelia sp.]|uniref:uracil-DNA glycosylase family protein n=1 Tax=Thomasclavelia sp. TaxID=3025757 RepID=UPI0025F7F71F|nr:uracil-DNA glycosylase family protein [Thomasclavelia sp.]
MDDFEKLLKQIKQCNICQETFEHGVAPVVWGNKNAKIMQISQAPSLKVHQLGRPFSDQSGKKLRQWYQIDEAIFYNQDNFYITSLAHCYPGKAKNGGDKKPPKICYQQWLFKEMELVNNQIYIIIGSYAAKVFFPDQKLDDLVFNDQVINGKLTYVLPHPSPLNRSWIKKHPEFDRRMANIASVVKKYCNCM